MEDGTRESTHSWREILLKLMALGMNSPKLAIEDGALGFWAAADQIYPDTRRQRSGAHKTANVLNMLYKSSQTKTKKRSHDIWMTEAKAVALKALDLFLETYIRKWHSVHSRISSNC